MITFEYKKPWWSGYAGAKESGRTLIIRLRITVEERVETPVHYHDRLYKFAAMCEKLGLDTEIGHSDGVVAAETDEDRHPANG